MSLPTVPRWGIRALALVLGFAALAEACSRTDVTGVTVGEVTVTPPSATVVPGEARAFTAEVRDEHGTNLPGSLVVWSSTDESVLSVSSEGVAVALGPGIAQVRATARGVTGWASVTVEAGPVIITANEDVDLFAQLDGASPDPVELLIENGGQGALTGLSAAVEYAAGQPAGWLSLALSSTTAPAILTITPETASLPRGSYHADVTVTSPVAEGGLTIGIDLSVVEDRPILRVTPPAVGFAAVEGGPPPGSQDIDVTNVGGGDLTQLSSAVSYEGPEGWLGAALSSSTAPAVLSLTVDGGGLSPGTYGATVRVESPAAVNSPRTVTVSLSVAARPEADLVVTKSGPTTVYRGDAAVFVLALRNDGPHDAAGVVLVDSLPGGLAFREASGGGRHDAGVVTWSLGTVPAGTTAVDSVRVLATASGELVNVARATGSTPDPVAANDRGAWTLTVSPEPADLAVSKVGPPLASLDETVRYVVTVTGNGPATAEGVVLVDSIPPGVVVVEAPPGATVTGRQVRWPRGSLEPGRTVADTVVVRVVATGELTDVARVLSESADPEPANDRAMFTTTVEHVADLALEKTGPTFGQRGTDITYGLTVVNQGPDPAVDVVVTDTLPDGTDFVSATGGGVEAGGVVTWPITPVMLPGAGLTFQVVVAVPTSAPATLRNVAAARSPTSDRDPADNVDEVTTSLLLGADVRVLKAGPAAGVAGTEITYGIDVEHVDGSVEATGVVLTDALPPEVRFVSATGGATHDPASRTVTWDVGDLQAGGKVSFGLTVAIGPDVAGDLDNTASVTSTSTDPVPQNDTSTATTTVTRVADLAVVKSGPASAEPGQVITYAVRVEHVDGPSTAVDVVVTDSLPDGVTFVSATGGGTYDDVSRTVVWDLGDLPAGGSADLGLTVLVDPTSTGTLENTARVASSSDDPVPQNDVSTVSTVVDLGPDVAVTKTGPASASAGEEIRWVLEVEHVGGATEAQGVVVQDVLPDAVTYVSDTGGLATVYDAVTGTLTWTLGTLSSGEGAALEVVADIGAATSGDLDNTAEVTTTSSDPVAGNDTSTATTAVTRVADLAVAKTGPAAAVAGEEITYTVTVEHVGGPSTAEGVVLTDPLPDGVSFVSATEDGVYDPGSRTVTWTLGDLSVGGNLAVELTVLVDQSVGGAVENTAEVSSLSTDPVAQNDTSTATTTIEKSADLAVTKSAPAQATPLSTITYTVEVRHLEGTGAATGVVVTDPLPAGVTYSSDSGGGSTSYDPASRTVTWTVGAVPKGNVVSLDIMVTVDLLTLGQVSNTATVTSKTIDPNPANDTSTATTTVELLPASSEAERGGPDTLPRLGR